MTEYLPPTFLNGRVTPSDYRKWLQRQAVQHRKRDKPRGNKKTIADYKKAIHKAVMKSNGLDPYTREQLVWELAGKWRNEDAKKGGLKYKRKFALCPSVDHVSYGKPNFKICAWRTNDAKGDLSITEFRDLCRKVVDAAKKTT